MVRQSYRDRMLAGVKDVYFTRWEGRDDAVVVVPEEGDISTIFHHGILGHVFWKEEAERRLQAPDVVYAAQEGF